MKAVIGKTKGMNMLRSLALPMGVSVLLVSQGVNALTLSSEPVQNTVHIFQPLDVEIALQDSRTKVRLKDIHINLADAATFEKYGIERKFFLTKLNFELKERANGQRYVHITSDELVKEPYLIFLLEITWPNGHMFREYTLLFDAPLTQPKTAGSSIALPSFDEQSVTTTPLPSDFIERYPTPSNSFDSTTSKPARDTVSRNQSEYQVQSGDTMWEIAMRTRPNRSLSVQQMMLAIQDANPDAFINNNINRVKAGYSLAIPSESEVLQRSFQQAVSQVTEQNAQQRAEKSDKVQISATGADSSLLDNSAAPSQNPQGQLTLVNVQIRNKLIMPVKPSKTALNV